ncbi:MAG: hypothetical protein AB7P03_27325 [Kofleriaceae bacterium]
MPDNEDKRAPAPAEPGNQGEGDRVAARRYDDQLRQFVAEGRVERAARDAAKAVDGPEAPGLRAAEQRGKAPARTGLVERARGVVNVLINVGRRIRKARHEHAHR